MKKYLYAAACAASLAFSETAWADTLSFGSLPGSDTFTATSITIVNPGNIGPIAGANVILRLLDRLASLVLV